ncbi:enoyl-CoA hydratase/isomerase family protein [Pseudaminobacter sp. 19-2017]|uniref:Enoyl-CoA hydratase/isomerase family protein n=2 Tax=Pseudaminobacter soli (ex Zhang et al. 2022) TaxID=2831468 RepID=A0A942E3J9_9HYPH|nr:3-hydroxyacyl-CoA dehydrogenase NAD-binding domain-containing protein [Pseudaminobacter soli]MBS3650483.1 enoyl-CoA hydratase/isomerase family protein [Pseudaminobacter soli]
MGMTISFSETVTGHIADGVLVITIDNPPVNAASAEMRAGLAAAVEHAHTSREITAVVVTGAGKNFVGGADIREFGKPMAEPILPQVVAAIEASEKPVVAAINGAAFGGGLELALACHSRVAAKGAKLGLPEVKLGIVPGAGGTQRLPRLTGIPAAIELIGTGRMAGAEEAMRLGMVDRLAEADVIEAAASAARALVGSSLRRTGQLQVPHADDQAAEAAAAKVLAKARGQAAPAEAIRLVRLAGEVGLDEGLAEERATFLRLRDSDQAKALRHVFFAERAAAKVAGLEGVEPRPVSTIGVAGLGLMGSGIALAALDAGYRVVAVEQSADAAQKGRVRIEGLLERAVKSGRLDDAGRSERLGRLTIADGLDALAAADLVIEAVFDDIEVKTKLFRELDGIVRPDAVLATNTSYLDPDALAAATSRPERVLGMHFFSPANIMRLVEVVRGAKTAPDVLATGLAVAKRLGKLPIVCGVCEGFVGNRIFSAYRREAEYLLEEGALPHEIDAAMEGYGFAMGPFAVFDLAGLEIAWARRKRQAATRDLSVRYVDIADRLCEAGRFGQKTGRGWYVYVDGKRQVDPDVTAMIEAARAAKGILARPIPNAEIVSRLLSTMAEEGRALLTEGIAERASDIDLVMINGYGFPAHKGGPMYQAGVSGG